MEWILLGLCAAMVLPGIVQGVRESVGEVRGEASEVWCVWRAALKELTGKRALSMEEIGNVMWCVVGLSRLGLVVACCLAVLGWALGLRWWWGGMVGLVPVLLLWGGGIVALAAQSCERGGRAVGLV